MDARRVSKTNRSLIEVNLPNWKKRYTLGDLESHWVYREEWILEPHWVVNTQRYEYKMLMLLWWSKLKHHRKEYCCDGTAIFKKTRIQLKTHTVSASVKTPKAIPVIRADGTCCSSEKSISITPSKLITSNQATCRPHEIIRAGRWGQVQQPEKIRIK